MLNNLQKIVDRYGQLGELLARPELLSSKEFKSHSKEYSYLSDLVLSIKRFWAAKKELDGLKLDIKSSDLELREIAKSCIPQAEEEFYESERLLKLALLPKDEDDHRNAILEVRAGTGGEEASLFAAQLYKMYQRYAEKLGWKFKILGTNDTGMGGYKEAIACIEGNGVFSKLKFESGVHRVQRVPETESSGRLHTSAATVSVLPEVEEIDLKIDDKDLKIETRKSSGPGGQSVNTTDSAVRITHIPTGITVDQQDEKSQHKNKAKALAVLRSRLYQMQRDKAENERSQMRRQQIGSGDRSERIRTYNFPQSRVTDHRINFTSYNIDAIVGEGDLCEIIDALSVENESRMLANFDKTNI